MSNQVRDHQCHDLDDGSQPRLMINVFDMAYPPLKASNSVACGLFWRKALGLGVKLCPPPRTRQHAVEQTITTITYQTYGSPWLSEISAMREIAKMGHYVALCTMN